jgi:hypothetical protein
MMDANGERVSQLEHTTGNFDDFGQIINDAIPTLTTSLCEIGIHDQMLYMVFILKAASFSEGLFAAVRNYDVKIYGFRDFQTTLYETGETSSCQEVMSRLHDELIQVQVSFPWQKLAAVKIFGGYQNFRTMFAMFRADVIDQLTQQPGSRK